MSEEAGENNKNNMASLPGLKSYLETAKQKYNPTGEKDLDSVKPVFILESDVFGETKAKQFYILNTEMYRAVRDVVLERCVKGLQRVRGLWRIYLDSEDERAKLLSNGLTIRLKSIPVYSRNPRVTIHEHENTVRVRVKDVPLSADDGQILRALEQYNCVVLNHFRERLRFENMLTNCQTGDRIVICKGPIMTTIPRSIPVGKYRATVLYPGQPNNKNMKCSKCLGQGHKSTDCKNDWKCRTCGEFGHKQNVCPKGMFDEEGESDMNADTSPNFQTEENDDDESDENSDDEKNENDDGENDEHQDNLDQDRLDETQEPVVDNSHNIAESDNPSITSQMVLADKPLTDEQSQSILDNQSDNNSNKSGSKPKSNQTHITGFLKENKANKSTPKKSSTSTVAKSPVTPTEILHEASSNGRKKKKKI